MYVQAYLAHLLDQLNLTQRLRILAWSSAGRSKARARIEMMQTYLCDASPSTDSPKDSPKVAMDSLQPNPPMILSTGVARMASQQNLPKVE